MKHVMAAFQQHFEASDEREGNNAFEEASTSALEFGEVCGLKRKLFRSVNRFRESKYKISVLERFTNLKWM